MNDYQFEFGKGGCGCASCYATTGFYHTGFASWPRGNPAGRKSITEYSAHVAHGKAFVGNIRAIPAFKITPEPYFSMTGIFTPPAANLTAQRWIARSYAWRDQVMPAWVPTCVPGQTRIKRGLAKLAERYRRTA